MIGYAGGGTSLAQNEPNMTSRWRGKPLQEFKPKEAYPLSP